MRQFPRRGAKTNPVAWTRQQTDAKRSCDLSDSVLLAEWPTGHDELRIENCKLKVIHHWTGIPASGGIGLRIDAMIPERDLCLFVVG